MRQQPDHWRASKLGYAAQFGFRPESGVGRLIDFIRDEHRAKYGCDYRLRRIGKNRFTAVKGDHSDYGVSFAADCADRFGTQVVKGD
jgi:hypothetical protein